MELVLFVTIHSNGTSVDRSTLLVNTDVHICDCCENILLLKHVFQTNYLVIV